MTSETLAEMLSRRRDTVGRKREEKKKKKNTPQDKLVGISWESTHVLRLFEGKNRRSLLVRKSTTPY